MEQADCRLVARFGDVRPHDWDRTAQHPQYRLYSVFILFRHALLHDMLHAGRIKELLLKRDWRYGGRAADHRVNPAPRHDGGAAILVGTQRRAMTAILLYHQPGRNGGA
jgi:hypothetical protein